MEFYTSAASDASDKYHVCEYLKAFCIISALVSISVTELWKFPQNVAPDENVSSEVGKAPKNPQNAYWKEALINIWLYMMDISKI